jgi:hypothetical protein
MDRFLTAIVLGGATTVAQLTMAHAQSEPIANQPRDLKSASATGDLSVLPAIPQGKSTILGGEIRDVDPVLDQFTLRVFGQRPLKIQFDERTQIYRDGTKIALRDLHSAQHAAVQTVLDGANIFAISIHMLSQNPEGECEGHILSYDQATRELTVGSSLSRDPIRLQLREDTPVVREGQSAFTSASAGQADLVYGALVSVKFDANEKGQAVATRVTVLARPGSDFAFSGKLSSLDMHAGLLVLVDPRDQRRYQVSFDPVHLRGSENLHIGDEIRVAANFDGTRYRAVEVTTSQTPQP